MEKLFKLKEHGTTVRTEIMAGFTTFLAMAYILVVNPLMLSGADAGAVSYTHLDVYKRQALYFRSNLV